jgi:hypothetical protein
MKVVIVNKSLAYLFGGGELYDLKTSRCLKAKGHRVTLVGGRPLFKAVSNNYLGDSRILVRTPDLRSISYRLPGADRISVLLFIECSATGFQVCCAA